MEKDKGLVVFHDKNIRRIWHENEWWFSIIDIIEVLTESERARKYWSDLKTQLNEQGFELSEKIGQLKLISSDGKYYITDCVDTKNAFRIIQSIPSPNQNLRDHMTDWELILTMVGEKATTDITAAKDSKGFAECKETAKDGGEIAGNTRKALEQKTGKNIVSKNNHLSIKL